MKRWMTILMWAAIAAVAPQTKAQKNEGPQPRYVDPGDAGHPPSDAVLLFNGRDMSGWVAKDGKPVVCRVESGVMPCTSGVGNMYTTAKFKDAQIHLEFREPLMPNQHGQLRGNSGVYLGGAYEIQVLDSYRNPTYATGVLGALYGQAAPLVNAARPPEHWETYDIVYHPLACDSAGNVTKNGT
ncbi:MAG: 3-keto-disaccharide hydrolase, partial [Bryobacteraceae bacterium]